MPRESNRVITGKQLTRLIELNILDEESSSSSDSDIEMLDFLSIDDDSGSSSGDSDCDLDLSEDKMICEHHVFHNNSPYPQSVCVQLAVTLDRFGHEGNGASLNRIMLMWGVSHGSMVNYTNRVMTALESAIGHEIAWPDCHATSLLGVLRVVVKAAK
ncbi:hypothetical protein R1sor_022638 [Riccia sorocarpa]|uniref:Uncharacterized protein n=1 Tax=Riccia sorocarpa TaxID=122646 RepID=A0ABD3GKE0_9MARC